MHWKIISGYGDVSCGESHGEAVMNMLMHWKRWGAAVDETKSEQRGGLSYETASIGGHPTARHNLPNHEGRNGTTLGMRNEISLVKVQRRKRQRGLGSYSSHAPGCS